MTRRSPCILLTTFCCLLAVATSALADPNTGWTYGGTATQRWTIVFPDKTTCEEFQARSRQPSSFARWKAQQEGKEVPVYPEYVCEQRSVPDTVDPRGPKGK